MLFDPALDIQLHTGVCVCVCVSVRVCVWQGDSSLMSLSLPPHTLTLYSAFHKLTHCAVHIL